MEKKLKIARQHIGELSMEVEELCKEVELQPPFSGEAITEMSRVCSPSTRKPYGVKRIRRVTGYARSSFQDLTR